MVNIITVSFLFLATLLALLLLAAWLEPFGFPNLFNKFIVLLLSDLCWGREDCHNIGMAVLVSPVRGCEAVDVSFFFDFVVIRPQDFYQVGVSVPRCNMETGEALLVFNVGVASSDHGCLNNLDHI